MVGVQNRDRRAAVRRFRAPVVDEQTFELDVPSEPAPSIQHALRENIQVLACPRCGGQLEFFLNALECKWCGSEYRSDSGVPQLFFPHDVLFGPHDVTQKVKSFYEANPFPKYDAHASHETLQEQSQRSRLARLLDDQIPSRALILDAGCGTGHLANFLALRKDRRVLGGDLSISALQHAKQFKDRCGIPNSGFVQMNLFRPPFCKATFDVVIANGVLHHTSDPLRGFASLASLLKPEGLFIFSLFSPFGRTGNDLRRLFFRLSKDKLAFLRWRKETQRGRFVQRYKQPHESRHRISKIVEDWFTANQFEYVYSSPRIGSRLIAGGEDLRYGRWPGDRSMQWQTELGMLFRGLVNDGLFTVIGRNKRQPKQIEAPEHVAEAAFA